MAAKRLHDEPTFSSSNLLNNYFPNQPSELREKLAQLKTKDIEKTTLSALDKASKLHVCVLGETIRDIYVHCNALGKTNKDPILAFVEHGRDAFWRSFCNSASYCSIC